jgi:hypothetical protein
MLGSKVTAEPPARFRDELAYITLVHAKLAISRKRLPGVVLVVVRNEPFHTPTFDVNLLAQGACGHGLFYVMGWNWAVPAF